MKSEFKIKAIELRRLGKSYSEILQTVPVAKSTLSLWLNNVGLSKNQKQRLTLKKILSGRKGGEVRRLARIKKQTLIKKSAEREIGTINHRELWLIGMALYWAEGSKQKENNPSQRLIFSNSDPDMARLYVEWLLKVVNVPSARINLSIYLHESHKRNIEEIISFWSDKIKFPKQRFDKIYFKKNKLNSARRNKGSSYHGLLRIEVNKSTDLNRKVAGWIEGVKLCGVV